MEPIVRRTTSALVDELLGLRAKLRAGIQPVEGTGSNLEAEANAAVVPAMTDGERADLQAQLRAVQDKLHALQRLGRDTAGVHFRSDGIEGMLLGEQVGIGLLRDYSMGYPEAFDGYLVRKFDGNRIRIRAGVVTPA